MFFDWFFSLQCFPSQRFCCVFASSVEAMALSTKKWDGLLEYVERLSQYASRNVSSEETKNFSMQDASVGTDSVWQDVEDDRPYEALHAWLKEQAVNFYQDERVNCHEALRFIVLEYSIAKGCAKVLVFDVEEQCHKLIVFC